VIDRLIDLTCSSSKSNELHYLQRHEEEDFCHIFIAVAIISVIVSNFLKSAPRPNRSSSHVSPSALCTTEVVHGDACPSRAPSTKEGLSQVPCMDDDDLIVVAYPSVPVSVHIDCSAFVQAREGGLARSLAPSPWRMTSWNACLGGLRLVAAGPSESIVDVVDGSVRWFFFFFFFFCGHLRSAHPQMHFSVDSFAIHASRVNS